MNIKYGDVISTLKTDKTEPSEKEKVIVDHLFRQNQSFVAKCFLDFKEVFLVIIISVLVNMPFTSNLLNKVSPIFENSVYIGIGVKALVVGVIFWLVNNFYLSKK